MSKKSNPLALLTSKEKRALRAIETLIRVSGISPTLGEIAAALGAASTATAHRYVELLQSKGYLTRRAGIARSIVLTQEVKNAPTA